MDLSRKLKLWSKCSAGGLPGEPRHWAYCKIESTAASPDALSKAQPEILRYRAPVHFTNDARRLLGFHRDHEWKLFY